MTLGEISDILVWGAVTAYTIAMVAFALDIARQSSVKTTALEGSALEKANAGGGVGAAHGASVLPGGTVGGSPAIRASKASIASAGDDGTGSGRRTKELGIAMSTIWVGAAMHLAAIVLRGLAAGRVPWANMYEFSLVGAFFAIGVFLVIQWRRDVRFLGMMVTLLAVAALILALRRFHIEADGVQPALQSYWLIIHVGIAVASTGVFTVAFALSCLQLLRDSRDNGAPFLHGLGTTMRGRTVLASPKLDFRWLDTIPNPVSLEALSFRLNAVGFVMWTFTLIGGSIWAEEAWGRYWGWDPKEVWTFVVWVVYAAYLHARTTRGWSGRRAAYFVLVGYACVLFNFTGVNLLFTGKHAYSGLGK